MEEVLGAYVVIDKDMARNCTDVVIVIQDKSGSNTPNTCSFKLYSVFQSVRACGSHLSYFIRVTNKFIGRSNFHNSYQLGLSKLFKGRFKSILKL